MQAWLRRVVAGANELEVEVDQTEHVTYPGTANLFHLDVLPDNRHQITRDQHIKSTTTCRTTGPQSTSSIASRKHCQQAKECMEGIGWERNFLGKMGNGSINEQFVETFIRSRPESVSTRKHSFQINRTHRVDLAEEELLHLVVERQDTGTGNTTKNVGTGTLEERLDTLLGDNLGTSVNHRLVVGTGTTRGHHHTTTDSVEGVRSETGTSGDTPTKSERSEEVALKRADEDDGLDRVVCVVSGMYKESKEA